MIRQRRTKLAATLAIQKTDDKPETLLPNGKTLPGTIRPGEDVESPEFSGF